MGLAKLPKSWQSHAGAQSLHVAAVNARQQGRDNPLRHLCPEVITQESPDAHIAIPSQWRQGDAQRHPQLALPRQQVCRQQTEQVRREGEKALRKQAQTVAPKDEDAPRSGIGRQ
jgi:hypothetical protein